MAGIPEQGAIRPPESTKTKIEQPTVTPEKKGLKGTGDEIKETFKSPAGQQIFSQEFSQSILKKIDQFSADFKSKFCDAKGAPDFRKIFGLLGLEKIYDQFKPNPESKASSPVKPSSSEPQTPSATASSSFAAESKTATPPTKPASTEGIKPTSTFRTAGFADDKSSETPANRPTQHPGGSIPERPSNAPSGRQFSQHLIEISKSNNDPYCQKVATQKRIADEIIQSIRNGNIPDACRPENMKTVTIKGQDGREVKVKVACDYLAVGSNQDYLRVPMSRYLAERISKEFPQYRMPTVQVVMSTISASNVGGNKQVYGPKLYVRSDAAMSSMECVAEHNYDRIDGLLGGKRDLVANGQILTIGGKKSIVITPESESSDHQSLFMTGLNTKKDKPVQGSISGSSAHKGAAGYYHWDYSQGYTAVGETVETPEGTMAYEDALRHPVYGQILTGNRGIINTPTPSQPVTSSSAIS